MLAMALWIVAALIALAVYGLHHEAALARAKVLILGELMLRARAQSLTSLELYRRFNRRINLGLIHLAIGDLEGEGFVCVSLDDSGKVERDGMPDRVVSLSLLATRIHPEGPKP